MTSSHDQTSHCVGAVIVDDAGRLLLVRRVNEPGRGRWSVPGGRVEAGETDHAALRREVAEETGLEIEIIRHLGSVLRRAPGGTYDIADYACRMTGGSLRPGDDADDVRWYHPADLAGLPIVPGLVEALTAWGCLL